MPAENAVLFDDWPPAAPPESPRVGDKTPPVAAAKPRFKAIDRRQSFLRTVDVDNLVDQEHPVRAIWSTVEKLDLSAFAAEVQAVEGSAGRPPIDPRLLVSLWIYGYSQGVGAGREISRLCDYHPAYQWLTGAERISAHTLSDFRVEHKAALEKLFVQVVGVLQAEGLVKLKRVMQDGTKIRANASKESFRRRGRLEECLEEARQQCAALATAGESESNAVQAAAQQRAAQQRAERLEAALEQIQQWEAEAGAGEEPRVSSTDPDGRQMKHADGGFAPSYNVQTTTDAEGKALVSIEVTQAGNDYAQLAGALDRMQRTLGSKPEQIVVDGGYVRQENILEAATQGVELIGPAQQPESKAASCYQRAGVKPEFYADRFTFDAADNCMYCPAGMRLAYQGKTKNQLVVIQKYQARAQDCAACAHKADCCPNNKTVGRSVQRSEYHQEIQAFQQRMCAPETQQLYRQRSEVAETPHLWIKAKFNLRRFHVRGLAKVGQEAIWAALTYNISLLLRHRKQVAAAL